MNKHKPKYRLTYMLGACSKFYFLEKKVWWWPFWISMFKESLSLTKHKVEALKEELETEIINDCKR